MNKLHAFKRGCFAKSQKGVVLFFALIALVAMSLAAAALVRSVDSGVLVAGNLAFKQSAILSAETGIAKAYSYINGNNGILNTQNSAGYYAIFDDSVNLTSSATWTDANSIRVDADSADLSGNLTRYIIQRMCREANVVSTEKAQKCLVGTGDAAANSKGGKSEGGGAGGGGWDFATGGDDAVVYRVTVRVAGPKNTFSYLQAFIY